MYKIESINYKIIQLTPVKSNRNNNVKRIIELVNQMHSKTSVSFDKKVREVKIKQQPKLSFYIHTTSTSVKFFMIIPEDYYKDFLQICRTTWRNIQIDEVEDLPMDFSQSTNYEMHYQYADCLSLTYHKGRNDLLNSNLQTITNLSQDEEVGIIYNLIPTSEKQSNYFHNKSEKQLASYKSGDNLKKDKSFKEYAINVAKYLVEWLDDFLVLIFNAKPKEISKYTRGISTPTSNKLSDEICKSQILICTKSRDKKSAEVLGERVCRSYKVINGSNTLTYSKVTKPIDIKRTIIMGARVNNTSINECTNFIGMPSTDIINQFSLIEHNKVLQLDAPLCLLDGEIRIGVLHNKEVKKDVFYSMDSEFKRLGRALIGGMGSGKSYYLQNIAKDIMKTKRGLVVIDYIDKCQLADAIKKVTPSDRLVEIDFSNVDQLQGFNFNEIKPKSDLPHHRLSCAMLKAQQMQLLLDSINDDDSKLSPRMVRYLVAGATLLYYINPSSSFKEIVDFLKYPKIRKDIFDSLNIEDRELLADEIDDLNDLTKVDTKGNMSNSDSKIEGILDRVVWLKTNFFTRTAFKKSGDENINFVELLNQSKVIIIKIPEDEFNTRMIRNVIATFFLNKVWISKQMDSSMQTELFMDEIHQCKNCQLLMESILVECRKFNLTPTLALHYLDQLTSRMRKALFSAGLSFILISGCDSEVFKDFSTLFEKDGYTEIDLAELDRFHALCLIRNEINIYSSFIVELPS